MTSHARTNEVTDQIAGRVSDSAHYLACPHPEGECDGDCQRTRYTKHETVNGERVHTDVTGRLHELCGWAKGAPKACVMVKGHGGMHQSNSGVTWPIARDNATKEATNG